MKLKQSKMMLADGFPAMPDFQSMEEGEATISDVYETQGIIAYVQKTLKADKNYSEGDKFIYDGVIYSATASIAKDATIVLSGSGANVEAVADVQTQLDTLPSGGSFDYSETEFDTGQKWIDGKTLYGKVLHFTEQQNSGSKSYSLSDMDIDFGFMTASMIKYGTLDKTWGSGCVGQNQTYFRFVSFETTAKTITVTIGGWSFTELYCIIFYTKTTP